MDVRKMRNELLGKRLVAALESRNMEAYYVETKEEAVKKALELIPKGSSINMGGATSVKECGLYEALSNGEYQFYDRDKVSTQEEKQEIALKAFTSDYFLGSVNAMSEDGVFINIDGNANRVAAYAYGPKHVLLIVGMNKVVKTEADAMSRARNEAAPINAQRFGIDTPCSPALYLYSSISSLTYFELFSLYTSNVHLFTRIAPAAAFFMPASDAYLSYDLSSKTVIKNICETSSLSS